jgi:hypothetical protein
MALQTESQTWRKKKQRATGISKYRGYRYHPQRSVAMRTMHHRSPFHRASSLTFSLSLASRVKKNSRVASRKWHRNDGISNIRNGSGRRNGMNHVDVGVA